MTWDPLPASDGTVDLTVLVHDHGNLDASKLSRLYASVDEVNSAATNFGVSLNLHTTIDTNSTHQIHLHEDTTSGCGGGALGCAEYAIFINTRASLPTDMETICTPARIRPVELQKRRYSAVLTGTRARIPIPLLARLNLITRP